MDTLKEVSLEMIRSLRSCVSIIDKQSGYFIMTPISCNYYIIKPKQLAKFSNWSTTWNKTTNANKLIISNLQRWTSKKYITYVSIHDWKLQGNTGRPGKVCWEYSDWEYLPFSGPHSHILIDLEEKINDKEKNINFQTTICMRATRATAYKNRSRLGQTVICGH